MDTLITVLQFFAGLSILIVLHELGHFLAAKYFGVRVEKFYLFFDFLFPLPKALNFSLFKKKVGETEYGIGWFPFGGYVQMAGIMDENMDKDALKKPVQEYEFRAKAPWKRLIILLGGIIMNILVAFTIYSFIAFTWGESYIKTEDLNHGVYAGHYANQLGIKHGDIITHVNGKKIEKAAEVPSEILLSLASNITIQRGSETIVIDNITDAFYKKLITSMKDTPFLDIAYSNVIEIGESEEFKSALKESGGLTGDRIIAVNGKATTYYQDIALNLRNKANKQVDLLIVRGNDTLSLKPTLSEHSKLGILPDVAEFKITERSYNFFQALIAGPIKTWKGLTSYTRQFKLIFNREIKGYKQIGGFGTIASLYSGGFSWQAFLTKTAWISVVLAFMNLLPIPALDGGHALFTIYEMIFRKPPPEKFLEYAQLAGMAILFALLIYANGNDIFRSFFK